MHAGRSKNSLGQPFPVIGIFEAQRLWRRAADSRSLQIRGHGPPAERSVLDLLGLISDAWTELRAIAVLPHTKSSVPGSGR